MIERIKQFIKQYTEKEKQKAEEIKQMEERVKELSLTRRDGFHPVQAANDKKEIRALQKEIKTYKEKKKKRMMILFCVAFFVILFTFAGIMAAVDKSDANESTYNDIQVITEPADAFIDDDTTLEDVAEEIDTGSELVMTENATDAVVTEADSDAELTEPAETTTEVITTQVPTTEEVIITTTSSYYYDDDEDDDAPDVIVPDEEESEGNLVWVPINGGTKYHLYAGCSNMENPMQVSIETAINNGYTPCGRCY